MSLGNYFKIVRVLTLFIGAFILAGCEGSQDKRSGPFKVGLLINSTTPGGFHTRSAAKIFMEETKKKIETGHLNDLSIKIIEKEIDLNPESAIQATRDLIFRERVNIIVGPNVSISALAAAPICELAKVPMISPGATNSAISAGKEYIFQVAFTDREQGVALSELMADQLLAESASVIYQISNPASREAAENFIKEFSSKGGFVNHKLSYSIFDEEATNRISKLDFSNEKWILLPNLHQDSMRQVKLLRKIGFTGRFIGSDSWAPIESAKNVEADGSILLQHWFPKAVTFDYRSKEFTKNFYQEFDSLPTSTAALTYDTLNLIAYHLDKTTISNQDVAQGLSEVRYAGITGEILLSAQRKRQPIFLIVKNNDVSLLNTERAEQHNLERNL